MNTTIQKQSSRVHPHEWVTLHDHAPNIGEIVLAYTSLGPRLGLMGADGNWRLFGLGHESHLAAQIEITVSHWMRIAPPTD